jgi:hypothetical protein
MRNHHQLAAAVVVAVVPRLKVASDNSNVPWTLASVFIQR